MFTKPQQSCRASDPVEWLFPASTVRYVANDVTEAASSTDCNRAAPSLVAQASSTRDNFTDIVEPGI